MSINKVFSDARGLGLIAGETSKNMKYVGHVCTIYFQIASVSRSSCWQLQDGHERSKSLWKYYREAFSAYMQSVTDRCGVM